MFKCRNCGHKDEFELMFDPSYKGPKNYIQKFNKENELVITIDAYTFKPDITFMNQHAVCSFCGGIYIWDYH